jgi:Arc/MetJ-type ribon-helix-helix transcriptional regulator
MIFHNIWTEAEAVMTKPMTLNVRVSGALGAFVAANVGEGGAYENVSEYVRDLIRRDKARSEREDFDRLKAELALAFAAPEDSYRPLDVETVIARNIRRHLA